MNKERLRRDVAEKRGPSASDELVDRARAEALADAEDLGGGPEFHPISPVDAYLARSGCGDSSGLDGESTSRLDASTIAAELLEAGQIDAGVEQAAIDAERSVPPSLQGWDLGEPTERTEPSPVTPESPSASVDDRIESTPNPEIQTGDRWSTPTGEWEERVALNQQRKRSRFDVRLPSIRVLVAIGVFGFAAIGWVASLLDGRDYLVDASVGDCFTVGTAEAIDQVPILDCAEEHDSELFAHVDMAAGFGSAFAGEDPMFDWLMAECIDRFPGYVGESYETSSYWVDVYIPTRESWSAGDRGGVCTLVVLDENLDVVTTTGSGRSSNSA